VRILREEIFRTDVAIGEIAAPTAGDANALADLFHVIDEQHAQATATGLRGAHHAGSAGANHNHIKACPERNRRVHGMDI